MLRADDGELTVDRPITLHLQRNWTVVESETISNQYAYARQVDMLRRRRKGRSRLPGAGRAGLAESGNSRRCA